MTDFPILAMSFILNLIAVLFVICCIALVLIILVQKGKGGGLSSAFGGGMSGGILGSKTGDFLTWVTIVLVGIMLFFAVILAKYYKPTVSSGDVDPFANQQAPITQPTGTTSGTTNTNTVTGNEESNSGVSLIEESGMTEPEVTSDEDIANDNSDSNQPGN